MRSIFLKGLSLILCGSMLFSPVIINADSDNYILIDSKDDLNSIRQNLSGKYQLTADIVFTEADFAEGGAFYNNGAGWSIIGSGYSARFTGELDGNGYSIVGLKSAITAESGSVYAGLFGYSGGYIHDLTMKNTTLSVTGGDHVYAGTVVAAGMGTIEDIAVDNCRITVRNMAVTGKAGGVAGRMFSGTVSRVSASGTVDVEGVSPSVGGIVGQSHAAITQAYSTVSLIADSRGDCYAGGITGTNEETVSYSVATGDLIITSASDGNVGGIVGWNQKSITDCLATGLQSRSVSHYDNFGGGVGINDGAANRIYYLNTSCADSPVISGVTALTATQLADKASYPNWDFDTDWAIGYLDGINHPVPSSAVYPMLRAEIDELLVDVAHPEQYTATSLKALRTATRTALSLTNTSPLSAYGNAIDGLKKAYNGLTEKTLTVSLHGKGDVSMDGTNAYGKSVELAATPDNGEVFTGFVLQGVLYPVDAINTIVNGSNADAYFRSESACTVVFRGKYGRVLKVQTVTSVDEIVAPQAPDLRGYTFMGWNTELPMLDLSEGCVSIDAVYAVDDSQQGCSVTLVNAVADRSVDEPLPFDACLKLTPAEIEGKTFSHWLVNGHVASTDAEYTLYVAGDDRVEAVYDAGLASAETSVQHTFTAKNGENYTLNVVGQVYLPKDATVIEYGTLFAADSRCENEDILTLNSMECDTLTVTSTSVSPNRRYLTYLSSVRPGVTRYIRSYMVYTNASGERQIVYSPVTSVTLPLE